MTRRSQPVSNSPGVGSRRDHEKTASVATVTPASCMRRMSSASTASSHCSGL